MNKFSKLVPWMTRLILVPPAVVLSLIAMRYLIHPVYSAALLGITFCINFGLTTARILLGGVPLGCAVFLAICIFSRRRVLVGLLFTSVLMAVVLLAGVLGMYGEPVAENVSLVGTESILLSLSGAGIALELGWRNYIRKTSPEVAAAAANYNAQ